MVTWLNDFTSDDSTNSLSSSCVGEFGMDHSCKGEDVGWLYIYKYIMVFQSEIVNSLGRLVGAPPGLESALYCHLRPWLLV